MVRKDIPTMFSISTKPATPIYYEKQKENEQEHGVIRSKPMRASYANLKLGRAFLLRAKSSLK